MAASEVENAYLLARAEAAEGALRALREGLAPTETESEEGDAEVIPLHPEADEDGPEEA